MKTTKSKQKRLDRALKLYRHNKPVLVLRDGRVKLAIPQGAKMDPETVINIEKMANAQYSSTGSVDSDYMLRLGGKTYSLVFRRDM